MKILQIKNKFVKAFVILLIAGQLSFSFAFVLVPKPAQAFWGVGDFTFNTTVADWYDVFMQMGVAALQKIATSYATKYLQRFVDKVTDKYRIKNYMYYENVLSGYYLNQYIAEKVSDPDLRGIYGILAKDVNSRATVTDSNGKTMPVMAALKQKLDTYYYKQGGLNANGTIYSPGSFSSDYEYFQAAQAYFAFPPNFAEQNVREQYASIASDSKAAANQEVAGNAASGGLKNDRSPLTGSLPHKCDSSSVVDPTQLDFAITATSEQDCTSSGGTWAVDAMGTVQAAIQNPSGMIKDFATMGIQELFKKMYETSNNPYSQIGQMLGSYIFNRLNVDKSDSSSVINEYGDSYQADSGSAPPIKEIDLDNDNIPDGEDTNSDGKLETCYHGGVAPDCTQSSEVISSPYFTPICTSLGTAVSGLKQFLEFMETNRNQIQAQGWRQKDNFVNPADSQIWGRRIGLANNSTDGLINSIQGYHSKYFDSMEIAVSRFASFMSDISQSIQKNQDLAQSYWGNSSGGYDNLHDNTANMAKYLGDSLAAIGKCEDPNIQAVGAIVPPTILGQSGENEGTGVPALSDALTLHTDHTDIVVAAKAELTAQEIDLTGDCGAYAITQLVAWRLKGESGGLLTRSAQDNSCSGFNSHYIAYPDGYIYDILADPGSANTPQWIPDGCGVDGTCPDRYSPAVDPGM